MPRALSVLLWLALAGAGGWALWSGFTQRRGEDWRAWPAVPTTIVRSAGIAEGGGIAGREVLITHRFTVGGQERESTVLFTRDELAGYADRCKPGTTLPWHYRPNDPENGRFDFAGPWPFRLRIGLGSILALAGLAFAVRALHADEIGD